MEIGFNDLVHYGVKGMRWGVRRSRGIKPVKRRNNTIKYSDKSIRDDRKNALKRRRKLSDEDIKQRIERFKLEQQLKSLTNDDIAPGKRFVSDTISSAGKKALSVMLAGAMVYGVKAAMTKQFNIAEAAGYIAANPNKKK